MKRRNNPTEARVERISGYCGRYAAKLLRDRGIDPRSATDADIRAFFVAHERERDERWPTARVYATLDGERISLSAWCRRLGISETRARVRVAELRASGLDEEAAATRLIAEVSRRRPSSAAA